MDDDRVPAAIAEVYDAADDLAVGRQSTVKRDRTRVYKRVRDNPLPALFAAYKRLGGEEPALSVPDRVGYEEAAVALDEDADIPVPHVIGTYGDVVEEEYVPGPLADDLLRDRADDPAALREIGGVMGAQLRDIHDSGYAKLDFLPTNMIADTAGLYTADEAPYALMDARRSPLLPDDRAVQLVQFDNEMVVPDATARDREIAEIVLLSDLKQRPAATYAPVRAGFDGVYGPVPERVERRSTLRAVAAPAFFAVLDRFVEGGDDVSRNRDLYRAARANTDAAAALQGEAVTLGETAAARVRRWTADIL